LAILDERRCPVPPPSCQKPSHKPSLLLALVCASIVAAHDRRWLARPVSALCPEGGHGPERISRLKARLLAPWEALLDHATRRGRPPGDPPALATRRAPLLAALLAVATTLLGVCRVPIRRRDLQDRLVCAYDRLHRDHGATVEEFCLALAIPARTFRFWRGRPPRPPSPPPPSPSPPRRNNRANGRFSLDVTAPGTQLGGDTTDLRLLGVDLKLVAVQDLGAREQHLWEAFALAEHETAQLVDRVVTDATRGREGLQLLTDQGTPYLAQAARDAYDSLGIEHAPQKEGAPTAKAPVERAFLTVKDALAPLLALTNRIAQAIPALRRADIARHVGTLLLAVFLRVYSAGRRHLPHPLAGEDPEVLRAVVEEQRDRARAEDRSVRLFLEAVHAEYAMPVPRESFVRAFRRYPLEDLREAERRFRPHACRCVARLCDRYFAAVVRDVHERAHRRRAADRTRARAAAEQRRSTEAALGHKADLDAHPEHRLVEGLDLLLAAWLPEERRFQLDGAVAAIPLRIAVRDLLRSDPPGAVDIIAAHVRDWEAAHADIPQSLCDAVRGVIAALIPNLDPQDTSPHPADLVGAILRPSARSTSDNQRPPPTPHLRI